MQLWFMGNVDVERVAGIFREALCFFMSHRKSPLTTQMFTDMFARYPVSDCGATDVLSDGSAN